MIMLECEIIKKVACTYIGINRYIRNRYTYGGD